MTDFLILLPFLLPTKKIFQIICPKGRKNILIFILVLLLVFLVLGDGFNDSLKYYIAP